MILKEEYTYFSLAGHFQNQTGHFWPAGMGLDGPAIAAGAAKKPDIVTIKYKSSIKKKKKKLSTITIA